MSIVDSLFNSLFKLKLWQEKYKRSIKKTPGIYSKTQVILNNNLCNNFYNFYGLPFYFQVLMPVILFEDFSREGGEIRWLFPKTKLRGWTLRRIFSHLLGNKAINIATNRTHWNLRCNIFWICLLNFSTFLLKNSIYDMRNVWHSYFPLYFDQK